MQSPSLVLSLDNPTKLTNAGYQGGHMDIEDPALAIMRAVNNWEYWWIYGPRDANGQEHSVRLIHNIPRIVKRV